MATYVSTPRSSDTLSSPLSETKRLGLTVTVCYPIPAWTIRSAVYDRDSAIHYRVGLNMRFHVRFHVQANRR
jgi:hypothetical protein